MNYITLAPYLMPVLSASLYRDPSQIDKQEYGISTCTFKDIKNFYLDAYEILAGYAILIKGLDNIKYRNRYDDFGKSMSTEAFQKLPKGKRIKELTVGEFFADAFSMKQDANELRNAVGHNEYTYDGITQQISYRTNANNDKWQKIYLLDFAQDCLGLFRCVLIMQFIVYECIREKYRITTEEMHLPVWIYKGVKSSSHCPCGSGKKYGKCCKKWIDSKPKELWDFPHRANMSFGL